MMHNPSVFPFYAPPPGANYSRNTHTTTTNTIENNHRLNKHEPISPALWALVIGSDGQMYPVTSDFVLDESMTQIGSVPIYMASPSTTITTASSTNSGHLWPGTSETNSLSSANAGLSTASSLSLATPGLSQFLPHSAAPPLLGVSWPPQHLMAAPQLPSAAAAATANASLPHQQQQQQRMLVPPSNHWGTAYSFMAHPLVASTAAAAAARFTPQQQHQHQQEKLRLSQMTPDLNTTSSLTETITTANAKTAATTKMEMNTAAIDNPAVTHATNQTAVAVATGTTSITPFPVRSQSTIRTTSAAPPPPPTTTTASPVCPRTKYPGNNDNDSEENNWNNNEQQQQGGGGEEANILENPSPQVCTRKRTHSFNEDEDNCSNVEQIDSNKTIQDDNNNNDTTAATKLQKPLSFPHRNLNTRADMWAARFDELLAYKQEHGHCHVPFAFPTNPALAHWVKRQRYHYKLYQEGRPSTMTPYRIQALQDIGFVWDSQETSWNEKYAELVAFQTQHGHCNVPSLYGPNPSLAVWVKHQRKQYRYWQEGAPSTLTPQRIGDLENIGFAWLLRSYHRISGKPKKSRIQQLSTSPVAPCTTTNA